jgi:hypothetical protein
MPGGFSIALTRPVFVAVTLKAHPRFSPKFQSVRRSRL